MTFAGNQIARRYYIQEAKIQIFLEESNVSMLVILVDVRSGFNAFAAFVDLNVS